MMTAAVTTTGTEHSFPHTTTFASDNKEGERDHNADDTEGEGDTSKRCRLKRREEA